MDGCDVINRLCEESHLLLPCFLEDFHVLLGCLGSGPSGQHSCSIHHLWKQGSNSTSLESTHKGVNLALEIHNTSTTTKTELPMVTLTWNAFITSFESAIIEAYFGGKRHCCCYLSRQGCS